MAAWQEESQNADNASFSFVARAPEPFFVQDCQFSGGAVGVRGVWSWSFWQPLKEGERGNHGGQEHQFGAGAGAEGAAGGRS